MIVVLLFPLRLTYAPGYLSMTSILLVINPFGFIYESLLEFNSIFTLSAALLILLPGIIFERKLKTRPISMKVRGQASAACVLTWVFSFVMLLFGGMYFLNPLFVNTPILAIAFFIVLPLISRETTLRSISSKYQELSYGFIASTLRRRFKREKILTGFLWIGIIFCPYLIYWVYMFWFPQLMFWSLFYAYSVDSGLPVFIGFDFLAYFRLNLASIDTFTLPIFALLSSVRFLFVREIFRFQAGAIKRSRLVSVAILGELLPSAVLTLIALATVPPGSFVPIFIPMPLLPIIGFIFIRFNKVIPITEELWPDYEHRMWYEKPKPQPQSLLIPHALRIEEETIKVPVTYLLVSQVRKRLSTHSD